MGSKTEHDQEGKNRVPGKEEKRCFPLDVDGTEWLQNIGKPRKYSLGLTRSMPTEGDITRTALNTPLTCTLTEGVRTSPPHRWGVARGGQALAQARMIRAQQSSG